MPKKKIALVTGGYSPEAVISLRSARQLFLAMDKKRYDPVMVHIDRNDWYARDPENGRTSIDRSDFSYRGKGKQKVTFDYALISIHGTPGEDGTLQAYFDMVGIPYSTCGVLASALTFNKIFCKNYLRHFGIRMARDYFLKAGREAGIEEIIGVTGLPCFIKPNRGGSSFGVSRIMNRKTLKKGIERARSEDREVLVEEFIPGTELTVGLFRTPLRQMVFPVTEIVSKNEFFDYEAKYTPGMADEIVPARISDALARKLQDHALQIYELLDCRGLVRVDFIVRDDVPFFLEVNTIPGMSAESIVPKMIRAAGMSEGEVLTHIIQGTIA